MENTPNKDDFHTKTRHINTLFQFIKTNKEEQFLEYISSLSHDEVDVNMRDENGNYLIFFAIMMNNRRILKKLIEYGSRMDIIDSEGYGILYYPIKFNYLEIIDILLEYDKKTVGISLVNLKDLRGAVPIFYAIKYKNRYALQELLSNGADPNYKNNENMNALHLAVLKKDVTMVRMLSKYIKNINARTNGGSTALHYACNFQLTEIVKILLERGASQDIIELEYDFYPIFYTVVQNNIDITKMLIDYGANPNHQDYMGNTIIHYAIMNNHYEILDYIIEKYVVKGKNINVYIEDINSKKDITGDHIDPNIVNIEGLTITHLLLYYYKEDYDKYLTKIIPHSNLNYQDNTGNTILHIIAENNLWEKFQGLLDMKKLNIFIRNNLGKTVMDMVHIQERENFLDTIIKSYYNYLKKYHDGWLLEWQNKCSAKDLNEINETECYKLIREAVLKEKISIPVKKGKKNITIVEDELVHFSTFTGSVLDMITGFKYLTKKYPDAVTLFHSNQENTPELEKYNQSLGIQENPHQHLIHFEIRWIYQRIFLPPGFETIVANIINSKKYKYIIIPIGIILSNGNHSNCLFYDIETKTMERFEPHGSDYPSQFNYNPDLLDEILYKKLSNVLSNIYKENVIIKYYKPKNYLPKIGFQTFENTEININKNIGDPNGFCTLWSIWYLDYRLRYVDKKPQHIVKNLIKQIKINNYSFRTIIRNYSKKITDLRDAYLAKIHRNINDYLNNKLSQNELKKLLIEILTDDTTF
ncbi:ankyrin repeat-containing protein [Tupanvirus soda lake]|uniref:Ankyrin repeat-containing protein n=2 Tax=Tupanvirus TaxID=2094720 RepID=A0A6N1NUX2_9VIRU|nr:ankyrin repeat-containing protein [Tupanvirus soda lake]QKU35193.1 ankyrin repeat-containing protein [Tupanvirus soda lake]